MEVISFESKAFAALMEKIDGIAAYVMEARQKETELSQGQEEKTSRKKEKWMLGEEVCECLGISPRTLQRYRTQRIIPFSICGKKIKYLRRDVEQFSERWMVQTTDKRVNGIIEAHSSNRKRRS